MTAPEEANHARSYGRSAGLLTIAFAVTGALMYLYFALASHNLTPDEYGKLVVLWTLVYVIGVTIFRPVEQLLAHSLARPAGPGGRARILGIAAAIQLGVAVITLAAMFALRDRVEGTGGLLEGNTEFLVLVTALAVFAVWFVVRGVFAGLRRFGAFAAMLILEAVVRVAMALALATGVTENRDIAIIAIAVAPLASLLVLPVLFVRWRPDQGAAPAVRQHLAAARPGLRSWRGALEGGAFAGALLVVLLCEQVILSAGPLFVKAVDGSAAAALTFNLLMIVRAPLLLFQAIATSMLPSLTRMWAPGDASGLQEFRRSVRGTVGALLAFTAGLIVVVAAVGPDAMQIAFGDEYSYDRSELLVVAVAAGLYLSAVALNQAVLAQGQVRRCAVVWIACAALFAVINLIPGIDPVTRVEAGFLAVAAVLCACLFAISRRPHPRETDVIEPGSARELETIVAEEI